MKDFFFLGVTTIAEEDLIQTMVDLITTMVDSTMADLTTTMADSITTMADWMLDAAVNADLIYFLSQMGVFKETVELLIVQVKEP